MRKSTRKKMKKRTILLIVFLSLILITIVGVYTALQVKLRSLENSLENYLITECGYEKSDILSIEASFSKMPQFPVAVYFRDKPNVKYVFTDRNANMWFQLSPYP